MITAKTEMKALVLDAAARRQAYNPSEPSCESKRMAAVSVRLDMMVQTWELLSDMPLVREKLWRK